MYTSTDAAAQAGGEDVQLEDGTALRAASAAGKVDHRFKLLRFIIDSFTRNLELVKALLAVGAPVDSGDSNDRTALHLASEAGNAAYTSSRPV